MARRVNGGTRTRTGTRDNHETMTGRWSGHGKQGNDDSEDSKEEDDNDNDNDNGDDEDGNDKDGHDKGPANRDDWDLTTGTTHDHGRCEDGDHHKMRAGTKTRPDHKTTRAPGTATAGYGEGEENETAMMATNKQGNHENQHPPSPLRATARRVNVRCEYATTTGERGEGRGPTTNDGDDTLPVPSLMSNCSWGGW
jgi:hypothetical protein